MTEEKRNSAVDAYIRGLGMWKAEVKELRAILLNCALAEELKWSKPCYTFQGKNIVLIQPFKKYCALLFFKGALLPDPDCVLVKTGPNTRTGRQIRFGSVNEIAELEPDIRAYVRAAMEVELAGLKA